MLIKLMDFETSSTVKILDQQFEDKETLEFPGGEVGVVDITPEHPKTEVPVAVMAGWGGTPEIYKDNILALAEAERRVISVDAPHGIEHGLDSEETKDMPDTILRKVAALAETIDEKGINKIDMNSHSQGCIEAVLFAKLYPEKVRNIVLMNPAGMVGKDSFWRLAFDFLKDSAKQYPESFKKGKLKQTMDMGNIVTTNSLLYPVRALKEVNAIAHTQMHDILKELQEKGIGVVVIHSVDDEAFSMERVQKMSNPEYEEALEEAYEASTEELSAATPEVEATRMDGFISIKGKHAEVALDGARMGRIADQMFTAMERKKEKNG